MSTYTVQFVLDYAIITTNPVLDGSHTTDEIIDFATTELYKNHGIDLSPGRYIAVREVNVLDENGDELEDVA